MEDNNNTNKEVNDNLQETVLNAPDSSEAKNSLYTSGTSEMPA